MIVGIIGGGASGMAAALAASENPNTQVILMERQSRLGRKLSATGNGRCNLSNINAQCNHYHGTEPAFAQPALQAFDPQATLDWFAGLGLCTVTEPSGKVYPYSDQANSVVDVLRLALERENITVKTGFEVQRIRKDADAFQVTGTEETLSCDRLIVACGGLAGTKLGGTLSGYQLLGKLGHKATRLRPALVQLKCGWNGISALKGVRANCKAEILKDGEVFAASCGEIQFTEYGISGPVIFEISRDVCQGAGQWVCKMDFLPQWEESRLENELVRRTKTNLPMDDILTGILHNRLGRVLTKAAGIKGKTRTCDLTPEEGRALAGAVKGFELVLTEPMGMDSAQVTAGGVLTKQFHPETMESRLVPGLYACGEVLDIDGDCGGFNLQWAWSSAYAASVSLTEGLL